MPLESIVSDALEGLSLKIRAVFDDLGQKTSLFIAAHEGFASWRAWGTTGYHSQLQTLPILVLEVFEIARTLRQKATQASPVDSNSLAKKSGNWHRVLGI